ncbi:MAG: 2-phosphosulfolactate phosphatase [Actinomycetota bacterium]|nr:2-phosphosulfolactate phosphatase [Actinomycetota bacterium]
MNARSGNGAPAAGTPYAQTAAAVRFDWGVQGAIAISGGADVVVVVDVLSFSTALSVAIDAGVEVFPYRFRDASAASFAASKQAVLAVGRSEAGTAGVSLSPLSVRAATLPGGSLAERGRLVLPSPNGSAIAKTLSERGSTVVGACLRNAPAVALWVQRHAGGTPIAVVAAGERWPGDTLRPAVEDLWGAGAVMSALGGIPSPEAAAAVAAYRLVARTLPESLAACASGRELIADGHGDEIGLAAESGTSAAVPVLQGECFRPA